MTSACQQYHTQILTWEKKLEHTLGLLRKQKKQHQMKEESSERHIRDMEEQLRKSYACAIFASASACLVNTSMHSTIEDLVQAKENLRHRNLRLR